MRWEGKYPEIEGGVVRWLKGNLPPAGFIVRNELPTDFDGSGTKVTVVVEQVPGGSPGGEGETGASIDIDLYADSINRLNDAIPVIVKAMTELPSSLFDVVEYDSTFGRLPYNNPKVRKASGGYVIGHRIR